MGYRDWATIPGKRCMDFGPLGSAWANDQLVPLPRASSSMRKYDKDRVEMQLAYSDEDEVRDAYNSADDLVPRRGMMQDWADYLDRCRDGEGAMRLFDAAQPSLAATALHSHFNHRELKATAQKQKSNFTGTRRASSLTRAKLLGNELRHRLAAIQSGDANYFAQISSPKHLEGFRPQLQLKRRIVFGA